jgi:hypothetical protein
MTTVIVALALGGASVGCTSSESPSSESTTVYRHAEQG